MAYESRRPRDTSEVSSYNRRQLDAEEYRFEDDEDDWGYSDYSTDSDLSNGFEPAWAHDVSAKGDLFFVETQSGDSTENNVGHRVTFAENNNSKNGVEHGESETGDKPKQKKGFSKLKGLIKKSASKDNVESLQLNGHASSSVVKEVVLSVDPARHNYGRRATLCESLFGIIPGHFGRKLFNKTSSTNNGASGKDSRIMVQGLVPDGEALKTGQIKLGDWLMSVNERDVTYDNIDSILVEITKPAEVRLKFQRTTPDHSPVSVVKAPPVCNENLVKLVSGERLDAYQPDLSKLPHVVLYLTLEGTSDSMQDKDDILYQFPKTDNKLVDVRGMFITLTHMLVDVTNNNAKSSTLLCDGRLIHIGYATEARDVLIIGMPADRVSILQINHIQEDIVRLMKVLYGSLGSAFGEESNRARLDHFFNLLFHRTLLRDEMASHGLHCQEPESEVFLDALHGVKSLHLTDEVKVNVDNILSELEAADFADMSDDYYDMRRSYTILGSCLFYKGFLISNHLHKQDLLDLSLYVKYYGLLSLSRQHEVGQVLVWKEVFPTRRCHVQVDPLIPGYTEPDARWFMMVIGLKHKLLCVLLEAGGCAAWAEGHPTPDPFYVDQAKATLLQLESIDVNNSCEERLQFNTSPSLVCADWFFPHYKGAKDETPKIQSSPRPGAKKGGVADSFFKKKPASPQVKTAASPRQDLESDADSTISDLSVPTTPKMDKARKTSAASDESEESSGSFNVFRSTRKGRTLPSAFDLSSMKRELNGGQTEYNVVRLVSGSENTLFHYISMDTLDGVFICPNDNTATAGCTHKELLKNFHNSCLLIRRGFEKTIRAKERQERGGPPSKLGEDTSLQSVKEQGILFQCTPANWVETKKTPPTMMYWVVGRLFFDPYPREVYVCFHDAAEQNLVEMAFKLNFGMMI